MEGFESYEYTADSSFHNFYFCSSGPKGHIVKKVHFKSFVDNLYNLSFGDYDPKTKQLNDKAVSNNSDMDKVFFTLARIIYEFSKQYPEARIYITGSTATRTRLYQIMINRYRDLITSVFKIQGCRNDEEETFISNKNYDSFILYKI